METWEYYTVSRRRVWLWNGIMESVTDTFDNIDEYVVKFAYDSHGLRIAYS